jgi:alkylation response protein AidB-like acyl-CoA dehydrogenase
MLTDGAIEALLTAAGPELQERFVPNMISGEWTSSMRLTEPQAGSDLLMVRARAVPEGNGAYKIFGTKIYITYGEHDMAKNISHLVLTRTPDAPECVKGISSFVVPKFLVNADGSLGERMMCSVFPLSTSLVLRLAQLQCCNLATMAAQLGTWLVKKTAV